MKTTLRWSLLALRFLPLCWLLFPSPACPATFEEALDTPGWAWTTGGTQPWTAQTEITHDRADAAVSGRLGSRGESSWLETTVDGPGAIAFWWRVSSFPDSIRLSFLVDDSYQRIISGEQPWMLECLALSPGPHTLRWEYFRDTFASGGDNLGWLDEVRFLTSSPPVIEVQPASQTVQAGQAVSR